MCSPASALLDRPVWSALTTTWRSLAEGDERALRLAADFGVFAALREDSDDARSALAALCPAGAGLGLVETAPVAPPPELELISNAACDQMVAETLSPIEVKFEVVELGDADAPEMLALARLTEPGPFYARTHELGRFIGVKRDGRLAAMAGERMRFPGYCEVSGVCTHPDFRGHGYAAGLSSLVAQNIVARGETPFLHVYPHNRPAIALYEALGFQHRRSMTLTILGRRS